MHGAAITRADTDVVVQHVDPSVALDASLGHRTAVLGARDITAKRRSLASRGTDPLLGLAPRGFVPVDDEDARPFASEEQRRRATVADGVSGRLACPRDDRHLAVEPPRHVKIPPRRRRAARRTYSAPSKPYGTAPR